MKPARKILLSVFLFSLLISSVSAQFEQKVTLQVSWSYHHPVGEKSFTDVFGDGFSTDMGLQFNLSRSFSLVTLLKYTTFKSNETNIFSNGEFKNIGISFCPKIKFLPGKKINPYIYAGGNLNYIAYSFDFIGEELKYQAPVNFGYTGGAGIDFKISDRFAIFIQGGYNSVFFNDKDQTDSEMKINSVYGEAGFHFSFFKSKSL